MLSYPYMSVYVIVVYAQNSHGLHFVCLQNATSPFSIFYEGLDLAIHKVNEGPFVKGFNNVGA